MHSSRRVLVVDDEKIIANTIALILTTHGHEIKVAYSAEEAIETVDGFLPEACISDVVMGRLSGIDLALYLRKHCPQCKILLISGNANYTDRLSAASPAGLDIPLLPKPVHPQIIVDFVENCQLLQ